MSDLHFGILFILGLSILGGTLGAWLFQRLKIPQVVGYIAAGLLVGESGFKILTTAGIAELRPFSLFALGIIGFLVGGELKLDTFRRYGKQFCAILLGEGIFAFLLVAAGTSGIIYYLTGNTTVAFAAGAVLGAIASATDPASTIDVLWEYRCRGVLTTSITAIVALDDALAMTLYAIGTGIAAVLLGNGGSISAELFKVGAELLGAFVLGGVGAVALTSLLRLLKADEKTLALALGIILLLIGAATTFHLDVILVAMTCGFVLTNMAPKRSENLFRLLRGFSNPIYVLFFVLVGARLAPSRFPLWLIGIVVIYVIGRSIGKIGGSYLGARLAGSPPAVRKYLGLGILSQGGVAVGLSIVAGQRLQTIALIDGFSLGDAVVFTVTATTLIVQIVGPAMVKVAALRAHEVGRNRTEEDILEGEKVSSWVTTALPSVREGDPLKEVIGLFSQENTNCLFVLAPNGQLQGTLPIGALKELLQEPGTWEWLVVSDVMEPPCEVALAEEPMSEAMLRMRQTGLEQCVVITNKTDRHPVGLLDLQTVLKRVKTMTLSPAEQDASQSVEPTDPSVSVNCTHG